jgi:hypothetical protein
MTAAASGGQHGHGARPATNTTQQRGSDYDELNLAYVDPVTHPIGGCKPGLLFTPPNRGVPIMIAAWDKYGNADCLTCANLSAKCDNGCAGYKAKPAQSVQDAKSRKLVHLPECEDCNDYSC